MFRVRPNALLLVTENFPSHFSFSKCIGSPSETLHVAYSQLPRRSVRCCFIWSQIDLVFRAQSTLVRMLPQSLVRLDASSLTRHNCSLTSFFFSCIPNILASSFQPLHSPSKQPLPRSHPFSSLVSLVLLLVVTSRKPVVF